MRVSRVEQQNKSQGVLKAGALGAGVTAALGYFAPLTSKEHEFYSASKAAIGEKVRKVRVNEVEKIAQEFKSGALNLSQPAFDVFESNKGAIADAVEGSSKLIQEIPSLAMEPVKNLLGRVDAVGAAKRSIEATNIKRAAKASRPIGYFALAGAFIAMSAKAVCNLFNSYLPKPEKEDNNEQLTMADILLKGLEPNN